MEPETPSRQLTPSLLAPQLVERGPQGPIEDFRPGDHQRYRVLYHRHRGEEDGAGDPAGEVAFLLVALLNVVMRLQMADYYSSDGVKSKYTAVMGADLGGVFTALFQECSSLHSKWNEYVTLFGTNLDRINLLNATSGPFFRLVQDVLLENVCVHLSRVTDPPKVAGKETLTIRRLQPLVDTKITQQVEGLVQACLAKCEATRDWRNRQFAHSDLSLAVDNKAKPLADVTRAGVKEALASLAAVLNLVELHYTGGTVGYDVFSDQHSGAWPLLDVLRDGVSVRESARDRGKHGRL